ncbi:MAG TPA: DUF4912 domain-containing protein [Verrucomicrobiae bacterium]|nr:DUF4912 domain-containing protein [Verrucomicrobiae bacterium]
MKPKKKSAKKKVVSLPAVPLREAPPLKSTSAQKIREPLPARGVKSQSQPVAAASQKAASPKETSGSKPASEVRKKRVEGVKAAAAPVPEPAAAKPPPKTDRPTKKPEAPEVPAQSKVKRVASRTPVAPVKVSPMKRKLSAKLPALVPEKAKPELSLPKKPSPPPALPAAVEPKLSKPAPLSPEPGASSPSKSSQRFPAAKAPARKVPAKIPPILLEGDQPQTDAPSGPGQRYAVAYGSSRASGVEPELPKAYGTQQLLVAARDPHWLYVHWDLTDDQLRHYVSASLERNLVLRIHAGSLSDKAEQEIQLAPEARHWFAHVERAGAKYFAQLGYYGKSGRWTVVASSSATLTPPDSMAEETTADFATIPFEVPMEKLLSLVKEALEENEPLAEALQEVRIEERPDLPEFPHHSASAQTVSTRTPDAAPAASDAAWTPSQEKALAEIISMDHVRRVWMGSMEITELIRRRVVQELAEESAAQRGKPGAAPTSPTPQGAVHAEAKAVTSPYGLQPRERGFWFNINSELIIYGATEPDAQVTIAGRPIRLRSDGSFSYRFALPDGNYELPVVAVSSDKTDGRAAELAFARTTEYRGDVGTHPQDPNLKRPEPDAL